MTVWDFLKVIDRRLGLSNRLRGLPASEFDLAGEKMLDWGWCLANLPRSPTLRILDIGCAQAPTVPAAVAMGHEVIGVDIDQVPYKLPNFTFYHADFLNCGFSGIMFDVIILCSVIEHIGLVGRYGQRNIPDGDLQAMHKVATLLAPGGILILTIPVGRDIVFTPWHRIYGVERLPRLLNGFVVEKENYLVKTKGGPWRSIKRDVALHVDRNGLSYALGEFLLRGHAV